MKVVTAGDTSIAIISYVAEDMSHGYVILVDKLEDIDSQYIYNRTQPRYKFHPEKNTGPEKWQLVEVKIVKMKFGEIVTIVRNTFFGLKEDEKFVIPVGDFLRGVDKLSNYKLIKEFQKLSANTPVDYFLYYNKRKRHFYAKSPAAIENTESFIEDLKKDFTHFTNLINTYGITKAAKIAPLLNDKHGVLLIKFQIKYLIGKLEKLQNINLSKLFICSFIRVTPKLFDSNTCLSLMGGDSLELVKLWIKENLPDSLIEPQAFQKWQDEQQVITKLLPKELLSLFQKVQGQSGSGEILRIGIASLDFLSQSFFIELEKLVEQTEQSDELRNALYKKVEFKTLLLLWRDQKIETLPVEPLRDNFDLLTIEDRKKLVQQLGWKEYLVLNSYTEISKPIIDNYFTYFKEQVNKHIKYCCFDLEIKASTGEIEELAYRTNQEEFEELNPGPEDIEKLKAELEKADVVIGHNIRKFDLVKLYGDEVPVLNVWDSLEIESILRPNAHSLALKTEHYAMEDVEHTLSLFLYQLYRVAADKEARSSIITLYQFEHLNENRISEFPFLEIKESLLDSLVKKLFHSEVSGINKFIQDLVPSTAQLIVCPESFWVHFRDDPSYHFAEADHFYSLVIDKEKCKKKFADLPFLRTCLDQFFNHCEKNGNQPYARLLSSYLTHQIEVHFPLEQICKQGNFNSKRTITSEWYFNNKKLPFPEGKTNEVVQLGSDLWKYTSKRRFGTFTQQELSSTAEGNSLWVWFSNGRSYAPVSLSFAKDLVKKITGSHFWIEREGLDKYILWGSNSKALVDNCTDIEFSNHYEVDSDLAELKATYVKYSNNAGSRLMDLNPETLYRDKYWDVKLKTLIHLLGSNRLEKNKCVMVVSRTDEVAILTKIIRSLGDWFLPSLKSNLRRRLERLIEEEKGIMIVTQEEFEQLLSYPLEEGVLYVIESLSPEELFEVSRDQVEKQVKATTEEDEENPENEGTELPHFSNVAGSIAKLNPYYDWLMYRVVLQQRDNELMVLDPRANSKLFDNFKCKPLAVDFKEIVEGKSRVFELISSKTKSLLYAPREFEYGNLQEHLDRISAALIDGHPFKPEQKDYLDIIFPAKDDVLVTLPTGVGKSVLFQGPALYRSSTTGKMSLVVSPLKALMEDHVMGLWKKGFWNGVEFINADKGPEVKDIYRKIAGGQLLMVFVTPERFRSKGFMKALEQRLEIDRGLEYFVFDEAHCISQWGSEFRPDYYYCAQMVRQIRKTFHSPLLLLSATVTKQVAVHLENALYEEV